VTAAYSLVQDLADQLAEAGYVAVAPDLLSRMGTNRGRTPFSAGRTKLPAANGKLFVTASVGLEARASVSRRTARGFVLRPAEV